MSRLHPEPILESHLFEVGSFLNAQLNTRIPAEAWIASVRHTWCDWRPNFGMQLRDGGALVGVLLAIYSDQQVSGQLQRFCNPHSWCVLREYRQQSIGLVLSVIKQADLNFTMLTPNPKVAEVFRALRFRDLRRDILVFPNLPFGISAERGARVEVEEDGILDLLGEAPRRDYLLHRQIPWLRFVAFGTREDACLAIYKPASLKRLPAARLLHVSDAASFNRHLPLLRRHLLFSARLLTTQVEERLVGLLRGWSHRTISGQAKLWQGATVQESSITNLYSELMSLDI